MKGLSIFGCFHDPPKKFFKMKPRSVFPRNSLFFSLKKVFDIYFESELLVVGYGFIEKSGRYFVDLKEDRGIFYLYYLKKEGKGWVSGFVPTLPRKALIWL